MHKLRNDLILIGSIILLAGIALILFFTLSPKENLVVYVYYDNELVYQTELKDKKEYQVNGVHIVIDDTGVIVEDSTCPDKLCKHQGKISIGGQTITCLPNKVYIKLAGKGVDISI